MDRLEDLCSLIATAIVIILLTSRACFWDFGHEIPFACGVLCDSFGSGDGQETEHCARLLEKRRKTLKAVSTVWGLIADLFLCTLCVLSTEGSESDPATLLTQAHFWACVLGSICLRFCGNPAVDLESRHLTMSFIMMNLTTVLAGASLPLQLQPLIGISRLLLGLLFASSPLQALLTNCGLSPAYIFVVVQHGSDFSARNIGLHVCEEVFMILNLSLVFFFVDSIFKKMEIITLKMEAKSQEAKATMDAARKLLNVTCDAYVHLTSDFHIKDPEQAFLELIAAGKEDQGLLEKLSILDFISPADRQRFSEVASAENVDSAQSLPIQLLDRLGTAIEARFYYVQVPTFEASSGRGPRGPEHLIGITEVISGQADDKSSRTQSKPEEDMRFLLGSGVQNGPGAAIQQEPSCHSQSNSRTRENQTEASWIQMKTIDSIRLMVDATGINDGFCIHSAEFNFNCNENAEMLPNLMEWVLPDSRRALFCWLQDHVNAFVAGSKTCDGAVPLEGLEIVDPMGQCLLARSVRALRLLNHGTQEEDRNLSENHGSLDAAPRTGTDVSSDGRSLSMATSMEEAPRTGTDVSIDGSLSMATSMEEAQELGGKILMEISLRDLYRFD